MFTSGITQPLSPKDFPFFFNDTPNPQACFYKAYNDGCHYVATMCVKSSNKGGGSGQHGKEDIDILFDSLYFQGLKDGYKRAGLTEYIKDGILKLFPEKQDLDEYIARKIKRALHNLHKRCKLFRRKAHLNRWNYFVTITFDDKKHTPESFRKKLRKCLSNLRTRRNWRYMGVFEYAPNTGRLHFHALMYVPHGEMLGKITTITDYDVHSGQMQTTYPNSFFGDNFGRNDFKELNAMELKNGNSIDYLLKYIGKSAERIVYSRGIPSVVYLKLCQTDLASEFNDFVTKYVLFDNVVDYERDILHAKYTQMTIRDYLRTA